MRERLIDAGSDPPLGALANGSSTDFILRAESWAVHVVVGDGTGERLVVRAAAAAATGRFELAADDATWRGLLADVPHAGEHNLLHLVRAGSIALFGDELDFARHQHLVRALLESARHRGSDGGAEAPPAAAPPPAMVGTYHRISTSAGNADIHVERVGSGPQVLAFATAGSDTTQWHGLIAGTDFAERYELITADLPWHGRSSPLQGQAVGSYRLTPTLYTEFIIAIADSLGLAAPTLAGASMAGAAVIHAVATKPARFAGAVSCQAGPDVRSRANPHHRGTQVNASLFIPEWVHGLMNPNSPAEFRQRVWWGYSSGGFGTYAADIASYQQWNFTEVEPLLSEHSPHIALLSGSFDTSVPPERTRELHRRIPNSSYREMPELGHFPHAENPEVFIRYFEPALERVLSNRRT